MSELFDRIRRSRSTTLLSHISSACRIIQLIRLFFLASPRNTATWCGSGVSSAADSIALGSHVGTHIDALCHFSCGGKLYGGMEAALVQSNAGGIREHSVDTIAPILRRGVLLDVAGQLNMDALPTDFAITPEHLKAAARAEIQSGDVVLLRTGWARYWNDAARYITGARERCRRVQARNWKARAG